MFASVSIDLDGLDLYHAIHGLEPPAAGNPVYEIAVPRFLEMFDALDLRATFFVVTRDLDDPRAVSALKRAVEAGHELASHTHSHPYDLSRLERPAVERELDLAADAIARHFGAPPVGFRAPGYNISDDLLDCLEQRGYAYDSSVLPSPPYYFAKAGVMAAMRLRGERSGSSLTDPRALMAPALPYRPDRRRFHRRGKGDRARGLWEIPMCVLPLARVPIIGTTLALLGPRLSTRALPVLRRSRPFLNLEFHGIDLLDESDEEVHSKLADKQPDLRRSVADKRRSYGAFIQRAAQDYRFGPLKEMVGHLS